MDIKDAARALVEQEAQQKLHAIQAAAEAWADVERMRQEIAEKEAGYVRLYQEALAAGWSTQTLRKIGLKPGQTAPKRRTSRKRSGSADSDAPAPRPDVSSATASTSVAGEVGDFTQSV